jgi:hypothetical protein
LAVSGAVREAVRRAVRGAVDGAVRDVVDGAAGEVVDEAVRRAVSGAVNLAVSGAVREAVRRAVHETAGDWYRYIGGTCWLSWQAYESFFRDVCGLEHDHIQSAKDYADAQMSAGHWWPHSRFVIVSDRPSEIHLLQRGPRGWGSHVLHNPNGMALKYRDGWGVYALNGVIVPAWLVETPAEDLDPATFATIENAEVRREFVRKVGVERLCQKLGTKVLDRSADGMYELHLVDLKGTTGLWPYLKMRNPSIGVYHMEAVEKSCRTVHEALVFRNGGEFEHIAPLT